MTWIGDIIDFYDELLIEWQESGAYLDTTWEDYLEQYREAAVNEAT